MLGAYLVIHQVPPVELFALNTKPKLLRLLHSKLGFEGTERVQSEINEGPAVHEI